VDAPLALASGSSTLLQRLLADRGKDPLVAVAIAAAVLHYDFGTGCQLVELILGHHHRQLAQIAVAVGDKVEFLVADFGDGELILGYDRRVGIGEILQNDAYRGRG